MIQAEAPLQWMSVRVAVIIGSMKDRACPLRHYRLITDHSKGIYYANFQPYMSMLRLPALMIHSLYNVVIYLKLLVV